MPEYGTDQVFSGKAVTVPGSLRVFRCWDVDAVDGKLLLKGTYRGFWPENRLEAKCESVPNLLYYHYAHVDANGVPTVPVEYCTCGIYGYYKPKGDFLSNWRILGSVRVSGKVLLGTEGVRAQYAEVESIVVSWPAGNTIRATSNMASHKVKKAIEERFADVPLYYWKWQWKRAFPPESVKHLIGQR